MVVDGEEGVNWEEEEDAVEEVDSRKSSSWSKRSTRGERGSLAVEFSDKELISVDLTCFAPSVAYPPRTQQLLVHRTCLPLDDSRNVELMLAVTAR